MRHFRVIVIEIPDEDTYTCRVRLIAAHPSANNGLRALESSAPYGWGQVIKNFACITLYCGARVSAYYILEEERYVR